MFLKIANLASKFIVYTFNKSSVIKYIIILKAKMPSNSLVSPFLKRKLIILCEIIIFLIVFNSFIGSVKSEKNKKPKCTLCKDLIDDFIAVRRNVTFGRRYLFKREY